jgi:hypothetical protein
MGVRERHCRNAAEGKLTRGTIETTTVPQRSRLELAGLILATAAAVKFRAIVHLPLG